MSTDKRLSVNYYKYLCQKIGSEEDVKVRRLAYVISDIGTKFCITSGSKGEGLNLRGSDFDIMMVAYKFKVYESERNYREVIFHDNKIPLIMDTDNTPPCFTLLRLLNNIDEQRTDLKQIVENDSQGSLLSNELYKMYYMNLTLSSPNSFLRKIHGPCLSDKKDIFDIAYCLKCDQWTSQAQPWIYRPRTTWPPVDIISKITSCETLNDYKGLTKEVDLMKGNFRIILETLELHILFKYHSLLYNLIHHSKTVHSRDIFMLYLPRAHQCLPQKSQNQLRSNNKWNYYKYRRDLSNLLIGTQSDALSGWLILASFFYVHKNYLISLDIIYYALSKCTDDKEPYPIKDIQLNQNQKSVLNFMNQEKIYIAMKLITVRSVKFSSRSSLVPQELQLMNQQFLKSRNSIISVCSPVAFAHCLRMLCYRHLPVHDITSCFQTSQTLTMLIRNYLSKKLNRKDIDDSILFSYENILFFPRQLL
ncbi:unnamed protein product [Mytilus coruscus]|uniref:Mab-21-like HhH/H2TH-like domain-containing protein n=1 Tax=Mytilus coruscus TaxID=42192 RepID=A0A6J8AAM9_MYTCO|nr:unnamed protein product [Mytilus coruscus]